MAGPPSEGGRPRRRRLSRSAEFERVYRQGRSKANRFLVLYTFPREEGEGAPPSHGASAAPADASAGPRDAGTAEAPGASRPDMPSVGMPGADTPKTPRADMPDTGPRLGLSVSRRVGGAVDRTRVKRVLREAFWQESPRLPAGADYVVVARPEVRGLAEREGAAGVRRALAELVDGVNGPRGGSET